MKVPVPGKMGELGWVMDDQVKRLANYIDNEALNNMASTNFTSTNTGGMVMPTYNQYRQKYQTSNPGVTAYIPSTEDIDFLRELLDHCSNTDAKNLLLTIFQTIKEPDVHPQISPEVVSAILTYCIEKYA